MGGRCSRWAPAAGARSGGRSVGWAKRNASSDRCMEDQAAALTCLRSPSPHTARRGGGAVGVAGSEARGRRKPQPWVAETRFATGTDRSETREKTRGARREQGKRPFASNASEDRPILPHKGLLFLAVLARLNVAAPCARACPRLVPSLF